MNDDNRSIINLIGEEGLSTLTDAATAIKLKILFFTPENITLERYTVENAFIDHYFLLMKNEGNRIADRLIINKFNREAIELHAKVLVDLYHYRMMITEAYLRNNPDRRNSEKLQTAKLEVSRYIDLNELSACFYMLVDNSLRYIDHVHSLLPEKEMRHLNAYETFVYSIAEFIEKIKALEPNDLNGHNVKDNPVRNIYEVIFRLFEFTDKPKKEQG